MIFKRYYTPELMDDFSIQDKRIDLALHELQIINKYLGGNNTTTKGLNILLQKFPSKLKVKILDVGSGSADTILSNKNNGYDINIYGIDINKRACKYAKSNSPELKVICGNIYSIPVKLNQFDIAHASLVLHHFKEKDIQYLLAKIIESVKYGIIINDLRRSIYAFIGIKLLTLIFSKSVMVKNDGPLSVKRGFVKKDLIKILDSLNINNYEIKKTWAFRWLIIIYKNN